MEHHFPTFTYLLSSFMIFIFFFKVMIKIKAKKQRSKTKNPYLKSPPGPRKLPFIGNLHQIGLPHSSLRDLANKYGPLMHVKLGEVSVIVVSSPKIAKMIMNTNDLHFADRGEVLAVPLLLPRQCRENCEINGYPIPLKTKVIINAWAIGRDQKYWSNAESFEPERFENSSIDYKGTNFEYIPFGAGRRMCPGISFGIANLELQLAQLLYHFDWKLPSETTPNDIDMSESFGMALRRKNNLYLIPIPYSPPTNIR